MFKPVEGKPDFVALEHRILDFWQKNNILQKYLQRNDSSEQRFSFLDGPITANNPMAVHHAWGRSLKDLYQRYHNMRGFKQRFQNGFDNQGLWVEVGVEKELGFKSKKDIEGYGIAKFVEKCKATTLHFAAVQTEQSQRLGYFMDWENSYYTLSEENNYGIWHFLKKVWQDGNLYKGRDSVPWCPRCGTAISQHEILQEEYQELTHDSIYFELPIVGREQEQFLVWTTTPWTIPGNVALAVNPEITYVELRISGKGGNGPRNSQGPSPKETEATVILAKSRLDVIKEPYEVLREFPGLELVGLKYIGPFDDLEAAQTARAENPETFHTVVAAEELVSGEEGTGIVHIAPGAGTEDFQLGREKDLPVIAVIDEAANYLEGFGDLSGRNAKDDPHLVLDHPKMSDFIFEIKPYPHRYPVCWRCKSELVWRVVDEWYIAMDDNRHSGAQNYRLRLQKVIKDVRWIPDFGYDRELDWLRNMEDWLISKKRYWGLALPIWECACGHFEVIGSQEELQERAAAGWDEFAGQTPHRPWVDAVKIKCPSCGELMSRIPDVGNPWLDAGIVSFSTLQYFADKSYWQQWFPADLVLECFMGQFKNWFYSLLAMSVVLEDMAPFKTLLGHGLVKDERGEEMHKSKGNAIWFDEAAEKMGVDVMRWLYVNQDSARDLWFGYGPADEVRRRFFLILWNCYKFFVSYAALDEFTPEDVIGDSAKLSVLDRWILSRLNSLVKTVGTELDNYQNPQAARAIESFVVNDLSTWYIRGIRSRVGPSAADVEDKQIVHQILYQVLMALTKLMAPMTPFWTEELYQNLRRETDPESVHLADWPSVAESSIDVKLESEMTTVRAIVERGHAARRDLGIKVRQPLVLLTVRGQAELVGDLVEVIKSELNVKAVKFTKGEELAVELDSQITPELKYEGLARELVRKIQDARRAADCNLSDRIRATFPSSEENLEAVKRFGEYIKSETLAEELVPGQELQVEVAPS